MTMTSGSGKAYVEKGCQTEPEGTCMDTSLLSPSRIIPGSPSHGSVIRASPGLSFTPILEASTRHFNKYSLLSYGRPSEPMFSCNRVISLPETAPSYSMKSVLKAGGLRVSSMSERPKPLLHPEDYDIPSEYFQYPLDSLLRFGGHCRVSMASHPELPRTPSPPSSPESITIIGNDIQVPPSFLCQTTNKTAYHNDGGWVTWAHSPPKPIPALHGPLSLPYARCPSGAEGTVIEEPGDIPRMIWGLGPGDAQSAHTRSSSSPDHGGYKLGTSRQQRTSHDVTSSGRRLPDQHVRTQTLLNDCLAEDTNSFHGLPAGKPTLRALYPYTSLSENSMLPVINPEEARNQGSSFDWTPLMRNSAQFEDLLAQSIEHLGFSVAGSVSNTPDCLPRIFVEPRPSEISIKQSQRPSTLDNAYQLNQMQQRQLPTPSSSSSQWSPYFSRQEIPNPSEFPAYNQQFKMPVLQAQAQPYYSSQLSSSTVNDASMELRRFVQERIENKGLNISNVDYSLEAPANIVRPSRPKSRTTQDVSGPNNLWTGTEPRLSPLYASPIANTSLPLLPNLNSSVNNSASVQSPTVITPLSPASPEQRRYLTPRQPRSAPLSRVVQRRLSSVPEEDQKALSEFASSGTNSPSGSGRDAGQPRVTSCPNIRPTNNSGIEQTGPPSPGITAFSPQTGTACMPGLEGLSDPNLALWDPVASTAQVTVKLPGHVKTTPSPSKKENISVGRSKTVRNHAGGSKSFAKTRGKPLKSKSTPRQ